ncbi:MAG: 1-acyl-sn-glycerol-3-phosphate acyltransferase [Caldicoprobacterales bacterium]|jgi:1-acyl-sn-glycerol-3-phosphate acyltransferase|nr:glycosyltransferase [Clostridiales bacterium]
MIIALVSDIFHANDNTSDFSIVNFAEELSNRGHKIRIVTYGDPQGSGQAWDSSFEFFYVSELKLPFASWASRRQHALLAGLSRTNMNKAISGADVVHICQPSMLGRAAQRAAKRLSVPVIAGFYLQPENMIRSIGLGWFPPAAHLIYVLIRWFFYRRFLHIHCVSKSVAAQLRSHGYKAWLHVISNEQNSLGGNMRRIESVYSSLSNKQNKNEYAKGSMFKLFSRLFYTGFAIPLMQFWMRVVLGAKIRGKRNLKGLRSAVTVCNHVHFLDSVLVGLALFPRKATFPTFTKNVKSLWPGKIVRILGGVSVPENISDVKIFFDELEFLLKKNHIVHFFPEGVLRPYDTCLRSFKKGAFHLAAQARVPIVPMLITFEQPKGVYRIIRKKPVMILHVGKPIEPVDADSQTDAKLRMKVIHERMNSFAKSNIAS